MNPLCSVCAFRIWKISSCLRMPVAPATVRSLAICVSFWMLMSFRSVMFSPDRRAAAVAAVVGRGAAGCGGGGCCACPWGCGGACGVRRRWCGGTGFGIGGLGWSGGVGGGRPVRGPRRSMALMIDLAWRLSNISAEIVDGGLTARRSYRGVILDLSIGPASRVSIHSRPLSLDDANQLRQRRPFARHQQRVTENLGRRPRRWRSTPRSAARCRATLPRAAASARSRAPS